MGPNSKQPKQINNHPNKMERAMLGIKLKDKVEMKVIKNKIKYNQDIVQVGEQSGAGRDM